jgi:hypothetical protein
LPVEERYACDRSFFITVECRFSDPDELSKQLADEKSNREQINLCFEASRDENWQPIFD